jgi:hypothetical protein
MGQIITSNIIMYDIKIVPDIFQIMFSKAIEDEGMYGSDSL